MAVDVSYLISLQDKFSGKINKINESTKRFDKSLGRTIGRFASFAAVGTVLADSVRKIALFEEQVSNLSAITGAVGDDLDFLQQKAIELGGATTKTATETVEAFKLIASAKPELLTNADALAKTTEEAIALAEASGLALPEAAKALTTSLNQFSLSADQSSRVINVLAAGSKFAAAEIPDLSMSLKEFGGVAQSLNVSLEESAAAVETLSEKGVKGSRAGIQIRNVLLKLGASADKKINPKIVGLSKALENLGEIQDDTAKLAKMFGTENILAAQTLIKSRHRVDELTEALTGTNIAYEQQAINTDNLVSDYKRLGSAWEKLVLNLNQGSGSISNSLRKATQFAAGFLEKLDEINKSDQERYDRQRDHFKGIYEPYLKGAKNESEFSDRALEVRKKISETIKKDAERFQELGGNKALERAKKMNSVGWSATRAIGERVGLVDTEKNLELELLNNRLRGLRQYEKEFYDLTRQGFQIIPEEMEEPEAVVGGLDKVEDQVTRITAAAPKTFNININNLVEEFNVNSQTVQEGAVAARETVVEELTRAVADVQARA
jgi:TP901 family phage tail tape measure protein